MVDTADCHEDDFGGNWEQGLTSREECRALHLAESYVDGLVQHTNPPDCIGTFVQVTSLLVDNLLGISTVYAGQQLQVTWSSCRVSTVRLLLESKVGTVAEWHMDARLESFAWTWSEDWSQSGASHRFRVVAWSHSQITSTSRWISTPPSRCANVGALVRIDYAETFSKSFSEGVVKNHGFVTVLSLCLVLVFQVVFGACVSC